MSLAWLKTSLAMWRGRRVYRARKHRFYHEQSKRPDWERKALATKWHKLEAEAIANIQRREQQIAALTSSVHTPVHPILASSWGYHPGVHDGVDLITEGDDILYAICDGTIIRASTGGWWGKGARASGGHSIADGDGVIVLRCGVDAGPFRKGLNFVYGHAEHPSVKAGQKVKAGDTIGRAGFANAWHVHFCVNGRSDDRGVGDRDPMPYVDYARRGAR